MLSVSIFYERSRHKIKFERISDISSEGEQTRIKMRNLGRRGEAHEIPFQGTSSGSLSEIVEMNLQTTRLLNLLQFIIPRACVRSTYVNGAAMGTAGSCSSSFIHRSPRNSLKFTTRCHLQNEKNRPEASRSVDIWTRSEIWNVRALSEIKSRNNEWRERNFV